LPIHLASLLLSQATLFVTLPPLGPPRILISLIVITAPLVGGSASLFSLTLLIESSPIFLGLIASL
jgi:hypothetical protein